jgi:uroporphyrinogen-III decarboxylase
MELFSNVKEGGGFMLSPGVSIPASARLENVKAFMDAAVKYGSY